MFEELDYQTTPLGNISLRRRSEPRFNGKILYEVKLGDEFLMSSLFTEAESQLSILGIAALKQHKLDHDLDIVIGGLGLGYTAVAALDDPSVKSVRIIDVMQPVIDWHQRGLVPHGERLTSDPRCEYVHADFFELATSTGGFDHAEPDKLVHAVLLDIDHSPRHWLNEENSSFYTEQSLGKLAEKLHSGGVFGLWSNDPVDNDFMELLNRVFQSAEPQVVTFPNPYTGNESTNIVYLGHKE